MSTKYVFIIIGLVLALGVGFLILNNIATPSTVNDDTPVDLPLVVSDPKDIKDGVYILDHQAVTLTQGISQETIAGSASTITTKYFGNQVDGDFNSDGLEDSAFLLTRETGGSGVFYYLAVALKTATGYRGINAILLGDRISPQTTAFANGEIVVNYGDRLPGEPMTASPTLGTSRYFKVVESSLQEIKK